MKYRESIANKIKAYLQAKGWAYHYDPVHGIFRVEADLECKIAAALVVYQAMEGGFLCYITISQQASMQRSAIIGEYLHRANYGLPNGNFEFDYDSGMIHFKTYFDCPDGNPTQKQLEEGMSIGLTVFDRYGDGLYALLQSESVAKQLIEDIEQ